MYIFKNPLLPQLFFKIKFNINKVFLSFKYLLPCIPF